MTVLELNGSHELVALLGVLRHELPVGGLLPAVLIEDLDRLVLVSRLVLQLFLCEIGVKAVVGLRGVLIDLLSKALSEQLEQFVVGRLVLIKLVDADATEVLSYASDGVFAARVLGIRTVARASPLLLPEFILAGDALLDGLVICPVERGVQLA